MQKTQLELLQEERGTNWAGSLQGYENLMDILVWPAFGDRVGVIEILGLGGYKRYADGQVSKRKKLVEGDKRGDYAGMLIDVPRGSAETAGSYIAERLESFVRGPIYSQRR
jgi:hypothetical protein